MDFQTMIQNQVAVDRNEEMKTSEILTLGELIAKIEPIAANQAPIIKKYHSEATVSFDFESLHPTGLSSWRGVYAELAIEFSEEGDAPTVNEFLKMLKGAIGKEYTGWKGGEFTMGKTTPLWVANRGNSGSTGVVGVLDEEYGVILLTKYLRS